MNEGIPPTRDGSAGAAGTSGLPHAVGSPPAGGSARGRTEGAAHVDQAQTLRIMVSSTAGKGRPSNGRASGRTSGKTSGQAGSKAAAWASESSTPWIVPHRVLVVVGGAAGVGATALARNLVAGANARGVRTMYVGPNHATPPRAGVADFFILDPGASRDVEGLADYLVIVASPDDCAVKGAYLALKRFRLSEPELPAGIVVNRARAPEEGAALAERIASAARSFIRGPEVEVLGWVLEDAEAASAGARGEAFVSSRPRSAAAAGVRLCVRRLWSKWRPRWRVVAA